MMLEIEEDIEAIETKVNDVRKKQSDILSSPFSDDEARHDLEELMAEIQHLSARTWTKLKAVKENVKKSESLKNSCIDSRMKSVQWNSLSHKFRQVLEEYSTVQIHYKERKKNMLQRQLEITGQAVTEEELDKMLNNGNTAVFTQGYIVETQKAKESLADIEERYSELLKIESCIRELNDMFLNISILVSNQGELIDSIANNVDRARNNVKNANDEFEEALERKRQARRKKIIIIVVVLLIFAALITILAVLVK